MTKITQDDILLLRWLHDRLVEVYGEDEHYVFMWRLRNIIEKLEDQLDAQEEDQ